MVQILLASREPNRSSILLEVLGRNHCATSVVSTAKEAAGAVEQKRCDLLLLGQELADGKGVGFLKSLRGRSSGRDLPVVALLEPGQSALRLEFFQEGADECLGLDQDVAECLARIKAVLRRTLVEPQEEVIRIGDVELNLTSYTLKIAGKEVPLTSKELDLLYVFLSSPNRVLSRPYLIERVWGYDYFGSPRTVDVHVRRLRKKLGKAQSLIGTVPCVGYKMVPPNHRKR